MFANLNNVLNPLGVFISLVIVMIRLVLMEWTDWLKLELSELVKFWQADENLSHFQWT